MEQDTVQRSKKNTVKFNPDASIEIYIKSMRSWDYKSPEFIAYAKKNYQDLMNGRKHSELPELYHKYNSATKGRRGRLQKFTFFLNWLFIKVTGQTEFIDYLKECYFLTRKMEKNKLKKDALVWKNFDSVLDKLYDDNPGSIFHFRDYLNEKTKSRYAEKRIIERNLVNINTDKFFNEAVGKEEIKKMAIMLWCPWISVEEFDEKFAKSSKFCRKFIDYLRIKKSATRRELMRKFTMKIQDLDKILSSLELRGYIIQDKEKHKVGLVVHLMDKRLWNPMMGFL
jgi:hypothetical protein